jgi:hypothetical protein
MPRTHLVYLASGTNSSLHAQVAYSMLSALAFKSDAAIEIHLFTDAADVYPLLQDHVTSEFLSPERITLLVPGVFDPYRLKLAVLRDIAQRYSSDACMFVDADTFFIKPYAPLLDDIKDGACVLHRREYLLSKHPTQQMKKFRRAIWGARLGNPLNGFSMWNSGVIGLPPNSISILDEAFKTLKRLSPHTRKKYLAEQFSITYAICLQGQPEAAEDYIFHYWYQKADYTAAIEKRLAVWKGLTLDAACSKLREGPLRLRAPRQKLHWWERALIRTSLRRRPEEIRGLPPQQ